MLQHEVTLGVCYDILLLNFINGAINDLEFVISPTMRESCEKHSAAEVLLYLFDRRGQIWNVNTFLRTASCGNNRPPG